MITKFSRLLMVLAAFAMLTITSCKKDKFDEPPHNTTDPNIANSTIADLRALFTSGNPITITGDIIIGGVVTADDKTGNFYKTIVIQDETGAIPVLINKSGLNADYPVGRKVYVKCQGLVLGQYGNNLQLGGFIDYSGAQPSVGNIASALTNKVIVKGPSVTPLEPKQIARLSDLNFTSDQSLLIKLDPVEFLDGNVPYADVINESSLSRTIKDCYGDVMDVRTSNFADFASKLTPAAGTKVSIIGVYTVFNNTRQLTIRSVSEVVNSSTPCGVDPALPTITIAELRAKFPMKGASPDYPDGVTPITITDDVNITGIVTANDRSGNFYKTIVIQDATGAIPILIDKKDLYKQFEIGRRVYINVNGTVLGQYGKNLQLGDYIDNSSATPAVGSISEARLPNRILNGALETPIVPRKISNLTDLNLNLDQSTLIELDPVRFDLTGVSFADIGNGASKSLAVKDCNNNAIDVRTSNFADFAAQLTPSGNVRMVGIYSVFGTSATLAPKGQFTIREISEVQTGSNCPSIIFSENFDGLSLSNNAVLSISGWQNITETGGVPYKYGNPFTSLKCAIAETFGASTGTNVTSWLITPPIDLSSTINENLSFTTSVKNAPISGSSTLAAYVSTDYDGSGSPQNFTWTNLNAIIATTSSSGTFSPFVSSGNLDLSSYSGTVYIAFKYVAVAAGRTTEIDDIKITGL